MFKAIRSFLESLFPFYIGLLGLFILLGIPGVLVCIVVIGMVSLIADGRYGDAAYVLLIVAICAGIAAFMDWVRKDASAFANELDERRRRRNLKLANDQYGGTMGPQKPTLQELKYEVKEIPLPSPPPTDPTPD